MLTHLKEQGNRADDTPDKPPLEGRQLLVDVSSLFRHSKSSHGSHRVELLAAHIAHRRELALVDHDLLRHSLRLAARLKEKRVKGEDLRTETDTAEALTSAASSW